jgi:xanthine/uracil permease
MAKQQATKATPTKVQAKRRPLSRKPKITEADLPSKNNFAILVAGVAVIIIGFIVTAVGGVESFTSLTLGPVILVIGYCVIIPIGILYRVKAKPKAETQAQ